ncbi:MAG TPA: YraN family protein [Solirubrobacteraceae bacterium]|jgi:putative endonuclease
MAADGRRSPPKACPTGASSGNARQGVRNKYKFAQRAHTRSARQTPSTGEADSKRDPRRPLGRHGEDLAIAHFARLGFELLASNEHRRSAELDLIVFNGHTLVFAEVKTRTTRDGSRKPQGAEQRTLGWPSIRQFKRSRQAAHAWLTEQGPNRPRASAMRFDVLRLLLDEDHQLVSLDHIQAAWEGVW